MVLRRIVLSVGLLAVAVAGAVASPAKETLPMTRLTVEMLDNEIEGTVVVSVDGVPPVKTDLARGRRSGLAGARGLLSGLIGGQRRSTVFDGEVPDEATGIETILTLKVLDMDGRATTETVSARFTFRATDALTRPFYQRGPLDLRAALDGMARAGGASGPLPAVEFGPPVSGTTLEAAEVRLGFPLHPDHRAILAGSGPLSLDDAWMPEPDAIATAREQMVALWGASPAAADALTSEERGVLDRSTMVWITAGDGYEALLAGSDGAMWILSQDHGLSLRRLAAAGDGPSSFRQALATSIASSAEPLLSAFGKGLIPVRRGEDNRYGLGVMRSMGVLEISLTPL